MIKYKDKTEFVNKRLVMFSVWSAVGWLLIVATFGFLTSLKFIWPDFLGGHYSTAWGPLRISHVNGVIFAWWTTSAMAVSFYIVPRLTGRKLWAEPLAWASIVGWNIAWAIAVLSMLLGYNQGIELGEAVWPVDVIVALPVVALCFVVIGTVLTREENKIYVSLWYLMAAVVWTALNWMLGNFGMGFFAAGANSADLHGFYLHNLVGLTITPMGVAMAYYFLPAAANKPLFSHKLSLIGFWTIAFIYPFSGAHHYIFTPISHWVQTVAIAFSIMLIIPVTTVVFNLFATMKGAWPKMIGSAPLKYLIVGNFFYMAVCFQGPLQALRTVQTATHYSDWVIAHSHMAILSTFTFWSFAAFFFMWPRITGKEINQKLANAQFWVALIGAVIMISSLTAGGLLQAGLWRNASVPFIETVQRMVPYWSIRSFSGVMLLTAFVMFAYILWDARKPLAEEVKEVLDGGE